VSNKTITHASIRDLLIKNPSAACLYKNVRINADGSMASCNASTTRTPLNYALGCVTYGNSGDAGIFCYTSLEKAKAALEADKRFRSGLQGAILSVIPVGATMRGADLVSPPNRSDQAYIMTATGVIPTSVVFKEVTEVDITDDVDYVLIGRAGSPDLGKRFKLSYKGQTIATIGLNGAVSVATGFKVVATNSNTDSVWFKVYKV